VEEEKKARIQLVIGEEQKQYLTSSAKRENLSVSAFIRKLVDEHHQRHKELELEAAARELFAEYQSNDELTAFTSLDGDEIL